MVKDFLKKLEAKGYKFFIEGEKTVKNYEVMQKLSIRIIPS